MKVGRGCVWAAAECCIAAPPRPAAMLDADPRARYIETMNTPTSQLVKAISQAVKRGMTLDAIARASGLTAGALTRILAGTRDPRLSTADKIAAGLGKKFLLKDKKKSLTTRKAKR